ncbi:hypothetical protein VO64_0322 [Pseudomonas synxantha]|uniref:Uncharacterized protein n=1 Tax=Pseudomonas synxantha TaxID=47883 RepID=A0AAU8TDN7_9PSED|nr:hypothetical protein VO64_0322 [Pseudomonas synxantha]
MLIKHFSRLSRAYLATSIEKNNAKAFFQLPDALAHHRLGCSKTPCGL